MATLNSGIYETQRNCRRHCCCRRLQYDACPTHSNDQVPNNCDCNCNNNNESTVISDYRNAFCVQQQQQQQQNHCARCCYLLAGGNYTYTLWIVKLNYPKDR